MTAVTAVTKSLWDRYQSTGDQDARRQLLDQYLGLVYHVARQMVVRVAGQVELDDLVSAGTLGLVLALESFDTGRGLAFSTYATPRIRGAILDDLRSRDWVPRSVRSKSRKIQAAVQHLEGRLGRRPEPREIAAVLGLDMDTYWSWEEVVGGATLVPFDTPVTPDGVERVRREEVLSDPKVREPAARLTKEEEVATLRDAIADLPEKERTVLSLYYYEELTLRQIAEILHLTESRISQIRTQALKRLRGRMQTQEA